MNITDLGKDLDTILNSDKEELAKELDKLNRGSLSSFVNMMTTSFWGLVAYKNEVLDDNKLTDIQREDTLKSIYSTMQKFEDTILVAQQILGNRENDSLTMI